MISLAMIFTIKNPNSDALEAAALTADPTAKAKEMLSALAVSPIGGSFVIVMYTDVGAAIVLHDGAEISEKEIREFTATRLADFKVPRVIVFVDEIPKGATGKIQRIGLAKALGLAQ